MAVRVIYKMKYMPLPMACDMFNMMVESLEQESKEAYEKMIASIDFKPQISKAECAFENWREINNDLNFTHSFVDMFKMSADDPWPIEALWVAYYCLNRILTCCDEKGEAGDLQVFYRNGEKFWVKTEGKKIIFLLPEDY